MIDNSFLTKLSIYALTFSVCIRYGFSSQGASSVTDSQKSNSQNLLLDRASGKFYEFGSKGPCGKNMIFYKHPMYDRYGFCDCDQGVKSKFPCSDHPVRRMIYIPSQRQCFPIFSQGPCQAGFWLNFGSDDRPECQRNLCLNKRSNPGSTDPVHQFWFHDPRRKSCFQTQTRGYCPVGLTLEVTHDSLIPKCRKKLCFSKLTSFRSFLTCKSGSRYSYYLKGCVTAIKPSRAQYYIGK